VERWRQAAQEMPMPSRADDGRAEGAEKARAQDQREDQSLKKELQRKEKRLAEMAALAGACEKKVGGLLLGGRGRLNQHRARGGRQSS